MKGEVASVISPTSVVASDTPSPSEGLTPAPGFEELNPREQLTRHLDFLGLGEDGTEFVVDLAPTEGGGHWMRLATVQRNLEATDTGVFLDVQDVLMTKKKRENNEKPSSKREGTHNWLFEAASIGAKEYGNKTFQVYFKPNQFVGKGHTVEAANVLRTRAFVGESDGAGGTLQEQWDRAMALEVLGLRFNALVASGGKSLHHFIRAPKGMAVGWERDKRINKKLCVAIKGDPRVINRDRSMRLAGFERQGGRRQALLKGTADELYASPEELEATLDRVLLERGVNDWDSAYQELGGAGEGDETLRSPSRASKWAPTKSWRSGPSAPCRCCGRTKSEMCEEWIFEEEDGSIRAGITCYVGETHKPPTTWDPVVSKWFGREIQLDLKELTFLPDGQPVQYDKAYSNSLGGFKVFLLDQSGPPRKLTEEEFEKEAGGGLVPPGSEVIDAEVVEPAAACDNGSGLAAKPLTRRDLEEFPLLIEKAFSKGPDKTEAFWATFNDVTYRWKDTHYKMISDELLKGMIMNVARQIVRDEGDQNCAHHPYLNGNCIATAFNWLKLATLKEPALVNPSGYINCRNGVAHVQLEGTTPQVSLEPHDPTKHFFLEPPGFAYDPQADQKEVDRFLECVEGEGQRHLLLQVLASAFAIDAIRNFGHRVPAILMIGQGENGKDTLRELVEKIFGQSAIAGISLRDWQQFDAGEGRGRFAVQQLSGARLSIASENKATLKLDTLEELKKAITGDPITIERKNRDPIRVEPKAAFLFFMNKKPLLDGGSAAIESRYGVINLPYSYSTRPKKWQRLADPRFKFDSEWVAVNVLPALLNLMIKAFGDAAQDGFDLGVCAEAMQDLRDGTSHLHDFLRESSYELGEPEDWVELKDIYNELKKWYQVERWMELTHHLTWIFIPTNDGDEPVKASRLLPKRLNALFPTVRGERSLEGHRRMLLYGLRKKVGVVVTPEQQSVKAAPSPWGCLFDELGYRDTADATR